MTGLTPLRHLLGSCEHAGAVLSRNAGNNAIGFFCDDCRSWVVDPKFGKRWIPKDHIGLRGVDLPNLPTVGEKIYRMCQGPCKQVAHCQLHHTAPRKLFGGDCDEWPMVYLCQGGHALWHTVVTPGLCTSYDPAAHGAQTIKLMKLEHIIAFTRYLVDYIKAQRAGAA